MTEAADVLTKVEYRIRPVTRYQITRYEEGHDPAIEGEAKHWSASTQLGEFDSGHVAYEVGYALAGAEHQRHGWPVGDMRMQYPRPLHEGVQAA